MDTTIEVSKLVEHLDHIKKQENVKLICDLYLSLSF